MAINTFKEENKKQILSFIIFFILLIVFLYLLYHFFLRPSSFEEASIIPRIYEKIKIDFSLFENPKFKKISSPSLLELKEEKPGRKNPFVPFE